MSTRTLPPAPPNMVWMSRTEMEALVRDQKRLRTADELWRMETGESLIATVDRITDAMMEDLRRGQLPRRKRAAPADGAGTAPGSITGSSLPSEPADFEP